ncbi:MAG: alpha/beta hydrolase [Ruminococcus sp.]|nr:alpha/beta hydrolase [Ruminococcus sp.]
MNFDKNSYIDKAVEMDDKRIHYREYRDILFVDKPIDDIFHRLNIYVPLSFYDGQSINGYNINNAPIFIPNSVGGYFPGYIQEVSESYTIRQALLHGYVVVSPSIRGKTLKTKNGKNYGKAPACIVDYKAAVRYLRSFSSSIPGDTNKIITNGTSAGGALSCLMGVTGNHPDYDDYLYEIGAADGDDSVFASSCYCPITNLDNADMAYEWQFNNIYSYHRGFYKKTDDNKDEYVSVDGKLEDSRINISKDLSAMFPDYINSLDLKNEKGESLTLDKYGDGSFKDYIKSVIINSAQNALEKGIDLFEYNWIKIKNNKVIDIDFFGYANSITRMKDAPAFDDINMRNLENDLFGDEDNDYAHFTEYSTFHSTVNGKKANEQIIKMMNPMYYINDEKAVTAKYFRIRHGECDRDTSLAISAILTLKLKEIGCCVNYSSPWNVPHSGDYDLDLMFKWIDSICK